MMDKAQDMSNSLADTVNNMGDTAGDMMDKARDMSNSLADTVNNMGDMAGDMVNQAKTLQEQAQSMANQILQNTGFDPESLPSDLMAMAAGLFQMSQTPAFQDLLQSVQANLSQAIPLEELKSQFQELLTDSDFVRTAKDLMEEHGNQQEDPAFQSAMQKMVQQKMQTVVENMGGGAKGSAATLLSLLVLFVAHVLL